jgi:putative redox protein
MLVEIQQVRGLTFVGKGDSNHWVAMDGSSEYGGAEAGTRPMELVLIALGGCTGMDVAWVLKKMRARYADLRIIINAERTEKDPKMFTKIRIKYSVRGDVSEGEIKRAIELSQTSYCPVSQILRRSAEVTYEYEILRE